MSTINERIKEIRLTLHVKQKDFAQRVLVSPAYISMVESGKETPSETLIKLISLEFQVSYEWLRDGIGEINAIGERDPLYRGKGMVDALSDVQPLLSRLGKAYLSCTEFERKKVFDIIVELAHLLNTDEYSQRKPLVVQFIRDIFCSGALMLDICARVSPDDYPDTQRAEKYIRQFKDECEETLQDMRKAFVFTSRNKNS